MRRDRCTAGALLLGAVLTSGCLPFTEPSEGELGRVEYSWAEGILGCIFGCDASAPLAVEGHARLSLLDADELPPLTVSSDDPEVALFTQDDVGEGSVRAEGVSPDRARVILRDARTGEVIDRLPIRVRHVTRIAPSQELPEEPLLMMVGADYHLGLRLFDGDREMVGVGAVRYELTSSLGTPQPVGAPLGLEAIGDALVALLAGYNHDSVDLEALEPGEGRVRVVAASGATLEVPYHIVTEGEITSISLSVEYGSSDEATEVTAHAYVGEGEVIGPRCVWSISPEDGPVQMTGSSGETAYLWSNGPGSAVVSCVIGSVSASATVTF